MTAVVSACLWMGAHCMLAGVMEATAVSVKIANLLTDVPVDALEEVFETLVEGNAFRLKRIVSNGHATEAGAWYDQPEEEWVLVLVGGAGLRFEGDAEVHALGPGDHLHIPTHRRHRVEWTAADGPTVWLAVYFHPTDGVA